MLILLLTVAECTPASCAPKVNPPFSSASDDPTAVQVGVPPSGVNIEPSNNDEVNLQHPLSVIKNADPATSIILEHGDTLEEHAPGKWTVNGHVIVRYKDYRLTADRADIDTDTGNVVFNGHTTLITPMGETVNSNPDGSLTINTKRDTYIVNDATTIVPTSELPAGLLLPVRIYGGTISGNAGLIDARGSTFTTCDFIEPHYSFLARDLTVIPGRSFIARHVTLFRRHHALFTIPYLFVPLDRRFPRQTLFPVVGHSPDEGYFAKFAFGYALASTLPGILRVDLLQKKGIGTGFEQNYGSDDRLSRGAGLLSLYHLHDKSTGSENYTGSLNHRQKIGQFYIDLGSQFQNNSYFAGNRKTMASSSTLGISSYTALSNFSLETSLSQSDYGVGKSRTLTSSLNESFTAPSGRQHVTTVFNYSDFGNPGSSGTSEQRRLDSNIDVTSSERRGTLELLTNKFVNLSSQSTTGFFSGLERIPEVRFMTDPRRLGIGNLLPQSAQLDVSIGAFNEPSTKTKAQRLHFNMDAGDTDFKLSKRSSFDVGGDYQQGFYSDNTAQYILSGHANYQLNIGNSSHLSAAYYYLRPYGFTPFQFDYIGTNNNLSLSMLLKENPKFHVSLGTGYDINAARAHTLFGSQPWQNLNVQMLISPNNAVRFRTSTAYDINHGKLMDIASALRLRPGHDVLFDVSSRYATQLHRVASINADLDLPFSRDRSEDAGWRIRAIGGFNGYTNAFDYKGVALTRSWHDWETTLQFEDSMGGLRPGGTITLNFRLKAFPAFEPFATGQFGQSYDTGVGDVY